MGVIAPKPLSSECATVDKCPLDSASFIQFCRETSLVRAERESDCFETRDSLRAARRGPKLVRPINYRTALERRRIKVRQTSQNGSLETGCLTYRTGGLSITA